MLTDVEIAAQATTKPITDIATDAGLLPEELEPYGRDKAKVSLSALSRLRDSRDGKLVLVTAITPTKAGEGKTTVCVGLAMALQRIGQRCIVTLREPSLGPCFGMKGGAAGGGYAQVLPMADINLHFTGDFHAITTAHNLLSALIDNALHHGTTDLDPRRVTWRRVVDINDRALRQIIVGLGKPTDGVPRQSGFDITVASEVMATLCLASSLGDLKQRLGRIVVGYTRDRRAVTVADLDAQGAMAVLLKDAIKPNLVQTIEGTPALIHGGPFANIAHGTNTVLATRLGLKLADFVVTEAGFGADLGAEKFCNIVAPSSGLRPDLAVVVATVRALQEQGLENLTQHVENLRDFGLPIVVALNRFPSDTPEDVQAILDHCAALNVPAAPCDVFTQGGAGGEELARLVAAAAETPSQLRNTYQPGDSLQTKIEAVAKKVYRADGVDFTATARRQLREFADYDALPVCLAKTQHSFSDDPSLTGAPRGFRITVRELVVNAGAGFVVALTGDIMRMPGLPKTPAAQRIDISDDGVITGLS